MGCDIHAYTEVKIAGQWHCYHRHQIDRWYALFAKMAGVRNYEEVEPIAQPRGLPPDLSVLVAFEHRRWAADAHSLSYLTRAEVVELEKWWRSQQPKEWAPLGYLPGDCWNADESDRKEFEDARLVFWFDN